MGPSAGAGGHEEIPPSYARGWDFGAVPLTQVSDYFVRSLSQIPGPGMPSEENPAAWLDFTGGMVHYSLYIFFIIVYLYLYVSS